MTTSTIHSARRYLSATSPAFCAPSVGRAARGPFLLSRPAARSCGEPRPSAMSTRHGLSRSTRATTGLTGSVSSTWRTSPSSRSLTRCLVDLPRSTGGMGQMPAGPHGRRASSCTRRLPGHRAASPPRHIRSRGPPAVAPSCRRAWPFHPQGRRETSIPRSTVGSDLTPVLRSIRSDGPTSGCGTGRCPLACTAAPAGIVMSGPSGTGDELPAAFRLVARSEPKCSPRGESPTLHKLSGRTTH